MKKEQKLNKACTHQDSVENKEYTWLSLLSPCILVVFYFKKLTHIIGYIQGRLAGQAEDTQAETALLCRWNSFYFRKPQVFACNQLLGQATLARVLIFLVVNSLMMLTIYKYLLSSTYTKVQLNNVLTIPMTIMLVEERPQVFTALAQSMHEWLGKGEGSGILCPFPSLSSPSSSVLCSHSAGQRDLVLHIS